MPMKRCKRPVVRWRAAFTEAESYENFGRRCQVQAYLRLGSAAVAEPAEGNQRTDRTTEDGIDPGF